MRKFIIDSPTSKRYALNFISRIELDEGLEIVIRKERKDQKDDQREGFHVLLKLFAEELGYSPDELKEVLKIKALGVEVKTVLGEEVHILKSTTKYTREDYSKLIETTYRTAAELGIVLPELKRK